MVCLSNFVIYCATADFLSHSAERCWMGHEVSEFECSMDLTRYKYLKLFPRITTACIVVVYQYFYCVLCDNFDKKSYLPLFYAPSI